MSTGRSEMPEVEVAATEVDSSVERTEKPEPRGLLYVEMNCTQEMESEFHAWYNTEHIPERLSVPGFVTGRRYAALEGWPRWLAAYELESSAVLDSAEYKRWLGPAETSWTRRVLACQSDFRRGVHDLGWVSHSPAAALEGDAEPQGLLAVRYDAPSAAIRELNVWHDTEYAPKLLDLPGVRSARRFSTAGSETEQLALYELSDPWVVQLPEFVRLWASGWQRIHPTLAAYKRNLYIRIL